MKEEWINPANVRNEGVGLSRTFDYLDIAKSFHDAIASTYHPVSYGHYGADTANPAWHRVVWEVADERTAPEIDTAVITSDDRQGTLAIATKESKKAAVAAAASARSVDAWQSALILTGPDALSTPTLTLFGSPVHLRPAVDPGDQTVPVHSPDDQLRSGKFRGVFRQTGYDHQGSYKDDKVLNSTLYCLVRIAQTMTWSKP